MAPPTISVDDDDWPEVAAINSHAVLIGYLSIGVRALGFLVFTWTTVVLLGGFVSMLEKKDFWCLTVITLVQTVMWEKASDVGGSLSYSLVTVGCLLYHRIPIGVRSSRATSKMIALVTWVVQVLVFSIVVFPLVVLYFDGLLVSTGISLWRMIQQDYGNPDGGANLKQALNVLYSLAVAQGMVHCYRTTKRFVRPALKVVANHYSLEIDLVREYLVETVEGCMKNPSFARGRNLVTYAVDLLMESKSGYCYISGVLILGTKTLSSYKQQYGLVKQLLFGSASFSQVVQRLVETFGPTSPYSSEIRVRAARIVATIAGRIHLDHFPSEGRMMIQCISSLLDTYSLRSEGDVERLHWDIHDELIPGPIATDYNGLVLQGLCILQGLAANEDNCRVISNTQGLISKVMSPLISDPLQGGEHHDEWCSMAEESLQLMKRLMATPTPPGETETTKLRNEISGNTQSIIRAVKGILECVRCQVLLKRQAVQVLLDLSVDTHTLASVMPGGSSSSTMFLWILLHVFLIPDYYFDWMCGATHLAEKSSDITILAGEKMQAMICPKTEESDTSMLPSVIGDVIGSLARTVAGAENNAYRIHAATIMEHLCRHYTKDDENLEVLKKAVANVMEEVLKEIVHWLETNEVLQAVPEANNGGNALLAEEGLDIEQGGVPHHNIEQEESSSTPHQQKGQQHQGIQLMEALVDLCSAIRSRWARWSSDDLTRQFNEITTKICSGQGMPDKTFRTLVGEAEEKLQEEKEASRLAAVSTS